MLNIIYLTPAALPGPIRAFSGCSLVLTVPTRLGEAAQRARWTRVLDKEI